MSVINVSKRSGQVEALDLNKFHKVVFWACEGLTGVSASEVELRSSIQFYDGISTTEIQETLIKAASELISADTPNYQHVASRLINLQLRKDVYGNHVPCHLYDHIHNVIRLGYYDPSILDMYSPEEIETLNTFINHDRDYNIPFVGMEQFRGKYAVKDRTTNKIFETPQMAFILISAIIFSKYKENRLKWVKDYYDAISTFDISLPTPIMAGLRTPQKQYSSCTLIETGDSLDEINATTSSIVRYVSQKAGIGIGVGRIRAVGSRVRNGDAVHTGVMPFLKLFQSAVSSCSQGGVRKGSATTYYPAFHYEIEDLLTLKNNKGTDDSRVRHIDYAVQFNKVLYERLLSGSDISLFSPHDVPDLYEAFFVDTDKFRTLYEKYEADTSIRKKTIKAIDLFSKFVQERKDTGRIYLMNVDHCNQHSAFIPEKAPVYMSNLCCEILLPTKPLKDINDPEGEISLCTLSAINWGKIKEPLDFERPCTLAVRGLDAILDLQEYPVVAAMISTKNRRPLGVGIINFAYWMAKNDLNYQHIDSKGLATIHEYAEAWSYYLIKASNRLAKEYGACPKNDDTKYSLGIVPIDTYKTEVDQLAPPTYQMDWDKLRDDLKRHGIRNSTVMALMPSECQSWDNRILLESGDTKNLHEICELHGIDWDSIEQSGLPQTIDFSVPMRLADNHLAYSINYTGVQELIEIEFEDGNTYKFTPNHLLLIRDGAQKRWKYVCQLDGSEDIVNINMPSETISEGIDDQEKKPL